MKSTLITILISLLYFLVGYIINKFEISQYSNKRIIISEYNTEINKALKFFPELKNEYISFKITNSDLPYFSRPSLSSFLFPMFKRKYIIGISNTSTKIRAPTLLKNLSVNARVGAMGHELSHTSFYKSKSIGAIVVIGIKYSINSKFKEYFEKMTDEIAISHNLNTYLLSWAEEVYPIKKFDGNRGEIYYSPNELIKIIKKKQKNEK